MQQQNNDNPSQVQELLSQAKRSTTNAATGGRRLVLDPATGRLVVKDANDQSAFHEGVPLQSVGGWA